MTDTNWKVSSRCLSSGCVETRAADGRVEMRQTDNPDAVASFTPDDWAEFIARVKAGEFDA
jgi:hypothetical protein